MTHSGQNNASVIGIFAVCLLFILAFSFLQLSPLQQLKSGDQIKERAFYVPGKDQISSPDDLVDKEFLPFEGVLTVGNLQNETWIKLTVAPSAKPLMLMVGPAATDYIRVFQRGTDGGWTSQEGGIRLRHDADASQTLSYSVPVLQADSDAGVRDSEIFVQTKSPTAFIQLKVHPASELLLYDAGNRMGLGVFLGVSLLIFTLCLIVWIATKDRLWLDVIAYDNAFAFYASTQSGALYQTFPEIAGQTALNLYTLSAALVTVAMCRFTLKALDLFNIHIGFKKVYKFGYVVGAVSMTLTLAGLNQYALLTINSIMMVYSLFGLVVVFKVKADDPVLLAGFRILLSVFCLVPLVYLATNIFQLPAKDALIYITAGQNNFYTLTMILILFGYRAQQQARQHLEVEREREVLKVRLEMEQAKLSEASSFLSMIVHEVKTPLNFIRLASSNLSSELKEYKEVAHTLNRIQSSVSNIDSILERSQEVDAQSAGALVIQRQEVDLAWLIRNGLVELDLTDRVTVTGPGHLPGEIDVEVFFLILRNILENAEKYSPEDSEIQIEYSAHNGQLHLRIMNQPGKVGFPNPDKLFQKFYRSPAALQISGSGLGLYWVHEVLKMMNGRICYSPTHTHICFELWIPV